MRKRWESSPLLSVIKIRRQRQHNFSARGTLHVTMWISFLCSHDNTFCVPLHSHDVEQLLNVRVHILLSNRYCQQNPYGPCYVFLHSLPFVRVVDVDTVSKALLKSKTSKGRAHWDKYDLRFFSLIWSVTKVKETLRTSVKKSKSILDSVAGHRLVKSIWS